MSEHDPWEGYRPQSSRKWNPDDPIESIDLLHPPNGIPEEILNRLWGLDEDDETGNEDPKKSKP